MEEHLIKTDRELLDLIGRFYKEKNVDLIRPYLHNNIAYASQWVDEKLHGTKNFLNYITAKIQTLKNSNSQIDYFVHRLIFKGNHFIILKDKSEIIPIVLNVKFKKNKISMIHLFPTRPVDFTFIYPSKAFDKARALAKEEKIFKKQNRKIKNNLLKSI